MDAIEGDDAPLLDYLYQSPLNISIFDRAGAVEFMSPTMAQVLLQIAPRRRLDNLFEIFSEHIPQLTSLVAGTSRNVIVDGLIIRLDGGTVVRYVALSLVRVDHHRFSATLSDVTDAVRQEEMQRQAVVRSITAVDGNRVSGHDGADRLNSVLDIPVCCWTRDLTVRSVNAAYAGALGVNPGALLGRTLGEVLTGLTLPEFRSKIEAVLHGVPQELERGGWYFTDSTPAHLVSQLFPYVEDGAITGFYEVVRDQSVARQHALVTESNHALLRRTGQLANAGGWILDLQTDTMFWSDQLYLVHAVGADFALSLQRTLSFYSGQDKVKISEAVRLALAEGRPWDLELAMTTAAGEMVWIRSLGAVDSEAQKPVRVVCCMMDIRQKKAFEQEILQHRHYLEEQVAQRTAALERSEFLNDHALALANAGHWSVQLNSGQGEYAWSARAIEILGDEVGPELRYDVQGALYQRIAQVDLAAANRVRAAYQALLTGHDPHFDVTHPYVHPRTGRVVWIHAIARMRHGTSGSPSHVYGVVMDVTAAKTTEEALRSAREQAESANRGKSQFLANMSHELRTPLNGMLGMLGLLEGTRVDAEQADYIGTARDSARHLLVLLNDILDISSLDAGKMLLKPDIVLFSGLWADVAHFARPTAEAKNLSLYVTCADDLPRWVWVDETRLKQILLNLLTNAIKFSDRGSIRMHVQTIGQSAVVGEMVGLQITVSDQGMGMSAQTSSRIFQRFEQGESGSARRFQGTGLGLEISRTLARSMQGDITVHSVEGEGSVFRVTVWLKVAAPPEPSPQSLATIAQHHAGAMVPLRQLDIVVAEDNAVNRKFMAVLLEKMGHRVRMAEDGEKALALINNRAPDLVIMDMHMPVMDGILATQTLRAMPGPASRVPIIALTADVMVDMRGRAFDAGINGYLTKPLDMAQLDLKLREMFSHRANDAPPSPAEIPAPVLLASQPVPAHPVQRRKRLFRSGDLALHLDMVRIGEVCLFAGAQAFSEMVHDFAYSDTGSFKILMDALATGQLANIGELAHSAKGESATLGFVAISQLAAGIEQRAPLFTPELAGAVMAELRAAWEIAKDMLLRLGYGGAAGKSVDTPSEDLECVQLIYTSTLSVFDAATLRDLHSVSLHKNGQLGVTGMLLFWRANVIQVLEGPSDVVHAVYQRIQADSRHHSLALIHDQRVAARAFEEWSTGICRDLMGAGSPVIEVFFGDKRVDIKSLVKPGIARDILCAFSSGQLEGTFGATRGTVASSVDNQGYDRNHTDRTPEC